MAASNISFYFVTDAEIHWRQAASFHQDAAGFKTLLYGLTGFLITAACILTLSWIAAPFVYDFTGTVLSVWHWAIQKAWLSSKRLVFCCLRKSDQSSSRSEKDLARADLEDEEHLLKAPDSPMSPITKDYNAISGDGWQLSKSKLYRALVLVATAALIILRAARPNEYAYFFMSWTLPLSPFVGAGQCLVGIDIVDVIGEGGWLNDKTSLASPPQWDFLPSESVPGFEDWYSCSGSNCTGQTGRLHYNPTKDPLHIDNLQDALLDELREVMDKGKAKIKHVILIKLESTRSDVFPIQEGSHIFDTIQESWGHDIPEEIQQRFADLTPMAERLTGFTSPFHDQSNSATPYGGIVGTDAFTTGTYTLKSLPGSICGIIPLVTDFNREYEHHIYQPCLPHIFNMLNTIDNGTRESKEDDYQTWPWTSLYMQSVTDGYDNQDKLTPKFGFDDWITKETLEDPSKNKHPPSTPPVCLFGYPDEVLEEHFHDAIADAEKNQKRLFLTHLTGATHEPWSLPHPWDSDRELIGNSEGGIYHLVQRYLNAQGYGDRWLKTMFDTLEATGVANETLVVMAGDHGVSITEGAITPYDDPHVGAFRVPLVISHPNLPPLTVNSSISLNQILPTILDLLLSTSSLPSASHSAASKILSLYEGQSLIRPQRTHTASGHQDWQFQVMNTGGTWLSMRSRTKPYRLIVPLRRDVEWMFMDSATDPYEKDTVKKFDAKEFAKVVGEKFGHEAEEWVGDAAYVARWWVKENWKKWRYNPCVIGDGD